MSTSLASVVKDPTPDYLQLTSPLIDMALREDIGSGDATSIAVAEAGRLTKGMIRSREEAVICGGKVVREVFHRVDKSIEVELRVADGERVEQGACVVSLTGPARSILTAERTALNFLQRLSGIATTTQRYVQAASEGGAQILDTRKTTPGWRPLEKYAVRMGGGTNHRFGLYDQIMIKDNHLAFLEAKVATSISVGVARCHEQFPGLRVEVEADNLEQVDDAVKAGADIILLDNMPDAQMAEAVRRVDGRAKLEASGGITLERVSSISKLGVDYISVGALTHSVTSVDLGLDFE